MAATPVHAKVAAAGIGGAIVTVALYALSLGGITVPGEVGAALGTIVSFAAGYLKSS